MELICQGETDEAWLFHGGPGSPVEHLAIPKSLTPGRVTWVRVHMQIHMQGDTGIQGDTPASA